MKRFALILSLFAAPATAQSLNASQQAAFDTILSPLEVTLAEQVGENASSLAPMLATCVVQSASGRELRRMGDGEISESDTDMMNKLMAKRDVQDCLVAAAQQG